MYDCTCVSKNFVHLHLCSVLLICVPVFVCVYVCACIYIMRVHVVCMCSCVPKSVCILCWKKEAVGWIKGLLCLKSRSFNAFMYSMKDIQIVFKQMDLLFLY